MDKYVKHFLIIVKHKYYVGVECFKRGLYWQGIMHDMSKFSPSEFFVSARYYQGTCSPITKEKEECGHSLVWLHHKGRNKHHCLYWTDRVDGKEVAIPIPEKYIQEMVCDYIGAGKAYSNGNWTPDEPWNYYQNVTKDTMFLHPKTREHFETLLKEIR